MYLLFSLEHSLFQMKTFKLNKIMYLDILGFIEFYIFKHSYCDEYYVCDSLLLLVDDINLSQAKSSCHFQTQKTSQKIRMNSSLIDYFGCRFHCRLLSCVFIETIKSSKRAPTHTKNDQNAIHSFKSNKSNSGVCLLSLKIWFA